MADPVTLMIAGTLAAAAGTVMDTQGNMAEADAEARLARKNAEAVGAQTGVAADAQRRRNRDLLARQTATIAEGGTGFTGSTRLLREQTAAELELEALGIEYEGELNRRGYKAQQKMAQQREKQIGKTGFLRVAGTLLGGIGQANAYSAARVPPTPGPK